jgi:hypothetical protein
MGSDIEVFAYHVKINDLGRLMTASPQVGVLGLTKRPPPCRRHEPSYLTLSYTIVAGALKGRRLGAGDGPEGVLRAISRRRPPTRRSEDDKYGFQEQQRYY